MRRYAIFSTVVLALVAGLVGVRQLSSAASDDGQVPADLVSNATNVEGAIMSVDFDVALPRRLPFEPTGSLAFVYYPSPGATAVDVDFLHGEDGYVQVTTLNRPSVPISGLYELVEAALPNGVNATYLDNGAAQMLMWSNDSMSYRITAASSSRIYSIDDLLAIAASMK